MYNTIKQHFTQIPVLHHIQIIDNVIKLIKRKIHSYKIIETQIQPTEKI